ncbi:MAG: hypothetical protein WC884_01380 [Candidatus Paceibacterota bacterium]
MKKLAFFVEGLTEQLLVKKLFEEVAGVNNIVIIEAKSAGKKGSLIINITAQSKKTKAKFYVLIVDCSRDTMVSPNVIENYQKMVKGGYAKILGLRDVFPLKYSNIPRIKMEMRKYIPTNPIPAHILLAVMETEAWFMAEHSHFKKIHNTLTVELIKKRLSYDLLVDNIELIENPAKELHKIYSIAGKAYSKTRNRISRTVNVLDYSNLYLNTINRMPHLKDLIKHIESFLS